MSSLFRVGFIRTQTFHWFQFYTYFLSKSHKVKKATPNTYTQMQETVFQGLFFFFSPVSRSAILLLWFFKQFYLSIKQCTTLRIAPDTQDILRYQLYLTSPMQCLRLWEIYMKVTLIVTQALPTLCETAYDCWRIEVNYIYNYTSETFTFTVIILLLHTNVCSVSSHWDCIIILQAYHGNTFPKKSVI